MTQPERVAPVNPLLACRLKTATDEHLVGGKARNLARLIALGVPVPDGLVLTGVAFERFLDSNGLGKQIEEIRESIDASNPATLYTESEKIAGLVKSARLPDEIRDLIHEISGGWPAGTLSVARSSAVGEDGVHASFAGQLDSVLNLATAADLERGVRTCWASYWSARVLFYQTARAARLAGMGVIVQQQVAARVSGVLFSRAPSGISAASSDDLVIEYCAGLGDGLVSGRLEPGRLIVSRSDLSVRRATARSSADSDPAIRQFLTPRRILDLSRLALRLDDDLGGPQDIEWSIDAHGELWILQSRLITTGSRPANRTTRTAVWSNANVNENFPQPISPLLYSIASLGYYHYFRNLGRAFGMSSWRLAAMERPLHGIIGVHGGRMYYNLTNIHAILRTAPFGDRLAAAFNQFVGAAELTEQPGNLVTWSKRGGRIAVLGELVRMAGCTTWQYVRLRRRLESFEQTVDAFAARTQPDRLRLLTLPELLEELRDFLSIRNHRWKNASLADAASMICYALLQYALKTAGCSPTLHNRLLRALTGVPSSIPPVRLWELSRTIRDDERLRALFERESASRVLDAVRRDSRFATFRSAFDRFLDDWGFRSSGELMLTVPSLQEDPLPVIELLKQYAATDGKPPAAAMARQAAERSAETSRLLRHLLRRSPGRAAIVWLLIRWTQCAVAYRERARLKQALLYTRCRRIALAIGACFVQTGTLRRQDDVFMLTWQEIDELASGRAMFPYRVREMVDLRLREHALLAVMQPTDTIRLPEGEYIPAGSAAKPAPCDELAVENQTASTLHGTGACGGRATARAAVLSAVREAGCLERGDVLVTRQTDPGWGPVFCLISGLVIERGGMLSHGAIIAREFGLPCVVGVRGATRRIPHGRLVTVDGDQGICTLDPHQSVSSPPRRPVVEVEHD
jgi:phosphohistidine swiveling domain-containing protein